MSTALPETDSNCTLNMLPVSAFGMKLPQEYITCTFIFLLYFVLLMVIVFKLLFPSFLVISHSDHPNFHHYSSLFSMFNICLKNAYSSLEVILPVY